MSLPPGEFVRRFGLHRSIEHHLFALSFTVLVVTGFAQRFHATPWADWVVLSLGGIDQMRMIHRYTGLGLAALTFQHIVVAVYGILFKHWAPSMVVHQGDFADAIHNLKYYFGLANHPARCGRYDYKQKFEYWGVIMGSFLMVITGFILWFPVLAFKVVPFLPGQAIPAAKALHSNESMLALLVIVIWHIYNVVLNPEVFPLDTSIFTGKISKERMRHEHPLELETLESSDSMMKLT